jgi:hypothetical protein
MQVYSGDVYGDQAGTVFTVDGQTGTLLVENLDLGRGKMLCSYSGRAVEFVSS